MKFLPYSSSIMSFGPLHPTFLRRTVPLLLVMLGTLLLPPSSDAATTAFTPGEIFYTNDLNEFAGGKTAEDLGWGGTAPASYVGATPRGSGYSGNVVIEATGTTRTSLNAPEITLPSFAAGEKIFFSSSFYAVNKNTSGARILFRTSNVQFVGGFGLQDATTRQFLIHTNGGTIYSTESYVANHWYEIALVVELHETDVALSIGSLYVRDLTLGESDFRPIAGLSNISMGYTEELNLNHFSFFRFEGFRSDAQVGAINVGYAGQVIPEPGAAALSAGALLLGCAFLSRKIGFHLSRK